MTTTVTEVSPTRTAPLAVRARPRPAPSLERRPGSIAAPSLLPTDAVHLARHLPRDLVDERLRTGRWVRLRRGAYVDAELVAATGYEGARRRAVARVRAEAAVAPPDRTVSFASAALVHGLPTWSLPRRTHLSQPVEPSVRRGDDVVRHVVHVPEEDRVVVDGLVVTSLERTVVDCLCSLAQHDGLVLVDAALRRGVDVDALVDRLEARRGGRGTRRAWTLLDLADAGSESPGESVVRYVMLAGGLPRPETQVRVVTRLGEHWTDLGWRERGLLLEYDGAGKYTDGGAAFMQEKRRHDAIVEAGSRVLRVTGADLTDPEGLVARVHRSFPADRRPSRSATSRLPQLPARRAVS